MRHLAIVLLACAALAAAVTGADDKDEGTKDELKKFAGTWRTVSMISDGREIEMDPFSDSEQVYEGTKVVFRFEGETRSEASVRLDPGASPKTIDLTYGTGALKGVVRKGIYKIDDNRITICWTSLQGERPTEFQGKAGSGNQLTVLRRVEPGDVRGADVLASNLVTKCLGVRENDQVQITGAPSDTALLEALAVHTRKQGAFPLLTLYTRKLARRMYDDVPEKYDAQKPELQLKLAEVFNAIISVDSADVDLATAGVAPGRLHAQAEANKAVVQMMLKRNTRILGLGNGLYPTLARAKALGVSQGELAEIFWGGVNVDYDQLQKTGTRIQKLFASGKEIHLTHPNGTDLTVKIEKRPVYVSDGVISADKEKRGGAACAAWLPAGECYVIPSEGAAEGRVIIDSMPFEGKHVRGLKLTFKSGKLTDMEAEEGLARLKDLYESATGKGKDQLAQIDLGFNPKVRIVPGSKMFAWMASGAVAVGVGANDWAGGDNTTTFGFTGQVVGGTLAIDDTVLVKEGKLVVSE
jgi:uncharacterized protein (TIGR03067 family)